MILSDLSVRRPVFATVISLLLVVFGVMAFMNLPLREFPDINPPVVSIETRYPGASAQIVETKITQRIEDRISGIEGIKTIQSSSSDGVSNVTVEFNLSRDIDAAANDVRERIARVLRDLPDEADPPEIFKVDASSDPIMWLNLTSPTMDELQLTDYAERYIVDRLSTVDGVARIRIGGERRYAMRIWLDRLALAARGLTVNDVEDALRRENVELPAGRIESREREFSVRVDRLYNTTDDFSRLVVSQGSDGYLIRLGEVARVELGAEDYRREIRGNGEPMIGMGVIRQSRANTLAVARAVRAEVALINPTLPEDMEIVMSYDTSVFIEEAIRQVYLTLGIAMSLVILVIFLFLGNIRSTLIPAVVVPVALTASFIVLLAMGFSINLLTLLALVLAIGLVVDDAIVVLENITRRIELGENPLLASFRGARQVGFAVIATTLVLVAVFVPISFLQGNVGRLFTEFAFAMVGAVCFSSFVALTLSPMMCSKLFKSRQVDNNGLSQRVDRLFKAIAFRYRNSLVWLMGYRWLAFVVMAVVLVGSWFLFRAIPTELAPSEDRGAFFVIMTGPEGSSFEHAQRYMRGVEDIVLPYTESGEARRALAIVPRGGGGATDSIVGGIAIIVMEDFNKRERPTQAVMAEVGAQLAQLPGVRAFPVMRQGLGGGGISKPVQFVLGGNTYEELAEWRDLITDRLNDDPRFLAVDSDYKETKPQFLVQVDKDRAAELGVSVENIGRTLETMLGSRRVTTFLDRGEEYDVMLQGEDDDRRTVSDMTNIYVRSDRTGELIPLTNLVSVREMADAASLNRFNRLRAVTIEANLAPGFTLGEALTHLENLVAEEIPQAQIGYKGESREFRDSSGTLGFILLMSLLVVFLVLAAQFESFIHPFIIMLTVPLAFAGALIGLWAFDSTLNIYSGIGIIMLIGLASKNGILMVEFANQMRDSGKSVRDALLQSAQTRLRPIMMTALSTGIGAMPLLLTTGAGSESRFTIGVVVFSGIIFSTLLTLFVIPVFYDLLAGFTRSPKALGRELDQLEEVTPMQD